MTEPLAPDLIARLERLGEDCPHISIDAKTPPTFWCTQCIAKVIAQLQDELVVLAKDGDWWREDRDQERAKRIELEEALTTLQQTVAQQQRELLKWEEGEARVCPEDVGFQEQIRTLEQTVAQQHEELETAKVEHTRAVLRYTVKGYTAGENASSKHWRKRAEQAEQTVARLEQEKAEILSVPMYAGTKADGTRADWMFRAKTAEQTCETLRAERDKLEQESDISKISRWQIRVKELEIALGAAKDELVFKQTDLDAARGYAEQSSIRANEEISKRERAEVAYTLSEQKRLVLIDSLDAARAEIVEKQERITALEDFMNPQEVCDATAKLRAALNARER